MLLLDEPAASLDPANTRLLEQNLQMLSEQGLGLMVATHDVDFAWRWATRVLVFRGGRLAGDGEPREIFENVSLLRTCGLEQPVLYRVGRVLGPCRAAAHCGGTGTGVETMKQALLAVSFGTSVPRARQDIEAVERVLAAGAPERAFCRAYTSPTIRRILAERGEPVSGCPRRWRRLRPRG